MKKKKLKTTNKLSPDQTRTKRVEILLTPSELSIIETAAVHHNTTMSRLIRDAALILASEIVQTETLKAEKSKTHSVNSWLTKPNKPETLKQGYAR